MCENIQNYAYISQDKSDEDMESWESDDAQEVTAAVTRQLSKAAPPDTIRFDGRDHKNVKIPRGRCRMPSCAKKPTTRGCKKCRVRRHLRCHDIYHERKEKIILVVHKFTFYEHANEINNICNMYVGNLNIAHDARCRPWHDGIRQIATLINQYM